MHDLLWPALAESENLAEIKNIVVDILSRVRRGGGRLGYVAGIIMSDGAEHMERNFKILEEHTFSVKEKHEIPVVSASEVFFPELLSRVLGKGVSRDDFELFWRSILASGHVTDMFMAPRWEQSRGARDEHDTAKKLGIRI
ncbi:MAG: DUF4406 domain-containing protein, partial [Patescibacteria group bacterium]